MEVFKDKFRREADKRLSRLHAEIPEGTPIPRSDGDVIGRLESLNQRKLDGRLNQADLDIELKAISIGILRFGISPEGERIAGELGKTLNGNQIRRG